MTEDSGEKELSEKRVAYYQTFLNAWVENRMETDKQLLVLSSLAIGLLMIFYDKLNTVLEFALWVASGLSFVITIVVILLIFRNNSSYIENLIGNDGDSASEKHLEKTLQFRTTLAFILFIAGISMAFILALFKTGFVITKITGG